MTPTPLYDGGIHASKPIGLPRVGRIHGADLWPGKAPRNVLPERSHLHALAKREAATGVSLVYVDEITTTIDKPDGLTIPQATAMLADIRDALPDAVKLVAYGFPSTQGVARNIRNVEDRRLYQWRRRFLQTCLVARDWVRAKIIDAGGAPFYVATEPHKHTPLSEAAAWELVIDTAISDYAAFDLPICPFYSDRYDGRPADDPRSVPLAPETLAAVLRRARQTGGIAWGVHDGGTRWAEADEPGTLEAK